MGGYTTSNARYEWCADSMCTVRSQEQYLQVNFGAEVVVEAISIERITTDYRRFHYVKKYYVEYGSNERQVHRAISKDSNTSVSLHS